MGAQDRRADAVVILKAAGGEWTTIGAGYGRGIFAEGITVSVNDAGPDTCGFMLRRRAVLPWPDLLAFNRADIWIGGTPVWGGRVWEAPLSDTGDDVIAVTGRGWQYHLDDDLLQRLYVHTDLTAYRDQRSFPSSTLSAHHATPQVGVGDGAITLIFPDGYTVTNNEQVVATIDLGASLAKRAVVSWERVGVSDADDTVRSRGSTSEDAAVAGDDSTGALTSASGTISHTFGAARRYHHVMVYRNGAGGTFGADQGVRITAIKLFGEAAWESGGASILKASDVVEDVLSSGAVPLLDTDTSRIEATSFSIPDLAPAGDISPRALLAAVNAYEGKLLGVDAAGRLFFRARPATPAVEVGAWPGSSFNDSSTNSGEGLYNQVIVRGAGADGSEIRELRTATSGLLARQGFNRTATLSAGSLLTSASAQALGDLWLEEKSSPPLKGTLTVQGFGGARAISGGPIHPSSLLLRAGELIRLGNLIDPTDGAVGRDATIRSVSYAHDTETATLELDNERGRFEAFLERLAVVTTQAVR